MFGSGFNVTLAAGRDDRDDRDPEFGYAKLGYRGTFNRLGATAVSLDYYRGEDIDSTGAESESVGLQIVQSVERYATELHAGVRGYTLDAAAGEPDLDDVLETLIGARVSF